MTRTTRLFYTHEELKELGITDDKMRDLGYFKKSFDTIGKVYEKIEYCKIEESKNDKQGL